MKKSELIASIAKLYPFLKLAQVTQIIDLVFEEMSKGLQYGRRIEIRGLGAFSVKQRQVQLSFPSDNQEQMTFGARNTVYFRMGKAFFDQLNPSNEY